MEARRITLIVLVAAMLLPVTSVLFSDDSDAAGEFDHYYFNQLTDNQKIIYNAMYDAYYETPVEPSPGAVLGVEGYYLTLGVTGYTLSASSTDVLSKMVASDAQAAWQATMLDLPMAWWTWSTDDAGWAVPAAGVTVSGASITEFSYKIRIDSAFVTGGRTVASCVSDTKAAFEALIASDEIEGDDALALVKSMNSYLCSSAFKYDTESTFSGNVYGALVVKDGDAHHIACMGYSKLFKMLCDRFGIDCVNVVGAAVQGRGAPEGHMWNVVRITIDGNPEVLGVDTTFNATGNDRMAFLLCGYSDETDGDSFVKTHQAFVAIYGATIAPYHFQSPELSKDGYTYPSDGGIIELLSTYLPWILMGIICAILAMVLLSIARRGD